ncbi:MAG: glutamate--tRNA ligase [Oscillospiraceae bacterium]|nr:glutamate--tRNA ligase [Oscillospiraceae bacterium]
MDQEIRTRFAPSPTGYMHVGNLRTALFAYLLTKSKNGKFILRIEDTDQERYIDGAVDIIYDTLKQTGLLWDEGPDVGGSFGPYIQSQRMSMYKEYALKLIESGDAYYCFCDKQRLEDLKTVQKLSGISPKYDGCCKNLTKEEIQKKLDAGKPYVIRQKMPSEGVTKFHDMVFGEIEVENTSLDDQILIKADGMPTYNFANVIDDHTMNITHVVRGSEYLSSTPKYNLLYKAFGWVPPVYIHCSPVMKNATEKLSKRNGDASYQDLIKKGYLSEAIINYIALLGWSPKFDQEIFSLDELILNFNIDGISKSPSIFDIEKLNYINGEYLRNKSLDEFHKIALPWIRKSVKRQDVDTKLIASVIQVRAEILSQIPEQLDFIDELPEYDLDLYISKKMKTTKESSFEILTKILPELEKLDDYTTQSLHELLINLAKELEVKNGYLLWPIRVAVSGKQFTPGGAIELCAILGKSEVINRIKKAIGLLGAR